MLMETVHHRYMYPENAFKGEHNPFEVKREIHD